ncbi:MAG TPA: sigma-70 family RNA polymerase sigma factor [Tepidisphaeraceae bacterium]|jgi:RNA polymerase sigma-70 factor (ECF subfamily)
MQSTQSQELLVEQSRRGDRQAFEELVRSTARLVYARAYMETGNVHRAEDLTQETFLTAWKNIAQVRDGKTFRPWLMSILHNAVVDAARRGGRKKRREDREMSREVERVDDAPGPGERMEREEQKERALAVMRGLPEEYRQVLMLRYLGGADYETIGRELAISNGSLRGLLNRGLAMLRERMARSEKKS